MNEIKRGGDSRHKLWEHDPNAIPPTEFESMFTSVRGQKSWCIVAGTRLIVWMRPVIGQSVSGERPAVTERDRDLAPTVIQGTMSLDIKTSRSSGLIELADAFPWKVTAYERLWLFANLERFREIADRDVERIANTR